MKCWWNGAYVRWSTTVPLGAEPSAPTCEVTRIPVARTSHSMFPSW